MRAMPRKKFITESGFTMIELIVVLGILATLAAIVAPRWEEYRSRMVVGEATNTLCMAFREARDAALLEQCEMQLEVSNSDRTISYWRYLNSAKLESQPVRKFKFSDEVYVCGTGDTSMVIGRGGRITSASGIDTQTSSVAGYSITVYDAVCSSKVLPIENHVFITLDGRTSIGSSI